MQLLENYGLDYSTDNLVDKFSTLVDLLHYRGQNQPNKQAYIFLQDGETESGSLTYGELDRQARAIAEANAQVYLKDIRNWLADSCYCISPF